MLGGDSSAGRNLPPAGPGTRRSDRGIGGCTAVRSSGNDANRCTLGRMHLAGIPIRDQDVLELARLLREAELVDVAEKPETGHDRETKILALTIVDRESILRVLDEPHDSLCELRGVLVREHEWRVREGLV